MLGDGFGKHGCVLEMSYAYETDRRLREEYCVKRQREAVIDELRSATQITEQNVLIELVDCGLRADSLQVLTLFPMVHVAWANGFVERGERREILRTATEEGMSPDSQSYQLLNSWLKEKPDPGLLKTWKDYVAAVRKILSPEAYNVLRQRSLSQATAVGRSAGGLLGLGAISRKEQTAIDELQQAFLT